MTRTRLVSLLCGAFVFLSACGSSDASTAAIEELDSELAVDLDDDGAQTEQSTTDDLLRVTAEPSGPVQRPEAEAVTGSIVRIIGLGCGLPAIGTGFAVEGHLIVTNAHLVAGRDVETLAVQNVDGDEFSADLIGFDPDLDLALLRVDGATFEPLNLVTEVPLVDGVAIGVRTEDEVNIVNEIEFTVDAPVIVNWDGVFQDTESRFRGLRMLGDIRRGDSGSPLLINDQDVIGLVQSTTRNQPQGYAVGAADISEFVTSVGPIDDAVGVVADRCT